MEKRQYAADHTQDFIVNDVRQTLFEAVSTFSGDLENDKCLQQLIEVESRMLQNAFRITQSDVDGHAKVAIKLLDLFQGFLEDIYLAIFCLRLFLRSQDV